MGIVRLRTNYMLLVLNGKSVLCDHGRCRPAFPWDLWPNGSLWESLTHITNDKIQIYFNPSRLLPFLWLSFSHFNQNSRFFCCSAFTCSAMGLKKLISFAISLLYFGLCVFFYMRKKLSKEKNQSYKFQNELCIFNGSALLDGSIDRRKLVRFIRSCNNSSSFVRPRASYLFVWGLNGIEDDELVLVSQLVNDWVYCVRNVRNRAHTRSVGGCVRV